uniref:Uncharacterized protein n=1 Tax=Cacopsylla melanoneura TaxID=428564 RepID=A0A8D8VT42_9HEMI
MPSRDTKRTDTKLIRISQGGETYRRDARGFYRARRRGTDFTESDEGGIYPRENRLSEFFFDDFGMCDFHTEVVALCKQNNRCRYIIQNVLHTEQILGMQILYVGKNNVGRYKNAEN